MIYLITGLVIFLGAHLFTTFREERSGLIARLGQDGYRGLYCLVSLLSIVLIVYGFHAYRTTGYIQVWQPPLLLQHIALFLNMPVFVLIAAAYLPGHIKSTLKHPMLAGVKLWAFAHLLANGDLGSMLLFSSFLIWAVIMRIALKRREAAEGAPDRTGPLRNDLIALLIGLVAYLAVFKWLHTLLIGIPPI